ncbi:hypothetical protein L3556_09730 [Candidatus Synechococcus calcipolaris G9]|uniref:Uncharacterized protein n=1 Tax=Candidatus Synechococcus calcipolaris G9 TaxID=1497997 RepID=A0ABT6F022_9SYNE|nr:hypothetical protein [Candidatus Synechococcus calcipolaris]MDG2991206.1 hypothetical protein [Candidatus Synechococcus calcipolaris G9]
MVLLKKIFAGLFGLLASLGKLVGIGKKGEFFVEMEPTPDHASPKQAVETVVEKDTKKAAPAQKKEPVAAAVTQPATKEPAVKEAAPVATVPYFQFARRRPGANMVGFLDMARQVRKPNF